MIKHCSKHLPNEGACWQKMGRNKNSAAPLWTVCRVLFLHGSAWAQCMMGHWIYRWATGWVIVACTLHLAMHCGMLRVAFSYSWSWISVAKHSGQLCKERICFVDVGALHSELRGVISETCQATVWGFLTKDGISAFLRKIRWNKETLSVSIGEANAA